MIPSERCNPARRARLVGAGAAAAALLGASAALAQPTKQLDPAAADALFKAARALIESGDYAAGCPKFEASLALNPSASTMLNIAKCHEHDGKTATAWEDYNRALVLNHETQGADRQKKLEAVAQQGVSALERRLPRLRVVVTAPPPGLKVTRDDKEIPTAALGEPLPLDPGPHQVRVSAPGYKPEARPVTLEEGKTATVEITLKIDTSPPSAPAPGDKPTASGGGVPAWAWATGAGGLLLGGAAAFFLVDDLSAIKALRANCQANPKGTYCAPGYDFAHDNARKDRGFPLFLGLGGASVVALTIAVVGIVRAPPAKKPDAPVTGMAVTPWIGLGGAGAMITGGF